MTLSHGQTRLVDTGECRVTQHQANTALSLCDQRGRFIVSLHTKTLSAIIDFTVRYTPSRPMSYILWKDTLSNIIPHYDWNYYIQ